MGVVTVAGDGRLDEIKAVVKRRAPDIHMRAVENAVGGQRGTVASLLAPRPFSMRQIGLFPKRRPTKRPLTNAPQAVVDDWFEKSGITIGSLADTAERVTRARCLLYTWKDVFAENLREIRPTDLIEHTIDLKTGATPVRGKVPLYTPRERDFSAKIFPELEQAGIIRRISSEWGARTKFLPRKKGSEQLHVVHNYISVNCEYVCGAPFSPCPIQL